MWYTGAEQLAVALRLGNASGAKGLRHLVRPKNPRPKGVVMNGWLSLS